MASTLQNIRATETGEATRLNLIANGWDGVLYTGEVVTPRTKSNAIVYRNAKSGEYVVIVSMRAAS